MTENLLENLTAEKNLLGLILVSPKNYWKVGGLKASDFAATANGKIYAVIAEFCEKQADISVTAVVERIKQIPDFESPKQASDYVRHAMTAAVDLDQVEHLAQIVIQCAQRRKMWVVLQSALFKLDGKDPAYFEPSQLLAEVINGMDEAVTSESFVRQQTDQDIGAELLEDLKEPPRFYSTGLEPLDRAMGGGLIIGKAYGIAARKKSGKTAMLATIAENLNQAGVKTLYVALEMGSKEIMQRVYARRMKVNPVGFLTDTRNKKYFQDSLVQAQKKATKNLSFLNYAGVSFSTLKSAMISAVKRGKFQVVIIDYWQLIGGKEPKKSEREHLDEVAQWIAEFSKSNQVATVTASQINQEGNTRGGEGMRLAFDQVYLMNPVEITTKAGTHIEVYMEMLDTRYTQWCNIGDEQNPAFKLNPNGVFFENNHSRTTEAA